MERTITSRLQDNKKAIFNILEEVRNNNMMLNNEQLKALVNIANSQEDIKMSIAGFKNFLNEIV